MLFQSQLGLGLIRSDSGKTLRRYRRAVARAERAENRLNRATMRRLRAELRSGVLNIELVTPLIESFTTAANNFAQASGTALGRVFDHPVLMVSNEDDVATAVYINDNVEFISDRVQVAPVPFTPAENRRAVKDLCKEYDIGVISPDPSDSDSE